MADDIVTTINAGNRDGTPFTPAQVNDIVTRLRNSCAHNTGDPDRCTRCGRENAYAVGGDAINLIEAQQAEIERLRGIAEELADAFQQVTDHGDACPICWESFKATRKAENCYGHAAIIELEARRG